MLEYQRYNPANGYTVGDPITGLELDFGPVAAGNHAPNVQVFSAAPQDGDINQISLYLESAGNHPQGQYGYYVSKTFTNNIAPGSDYLTDHFTVTPNVSTFVTGGVELNPDCEEYVWLDAFVPAGSKPGTGHINYRFVYDFC